MSVPGRKWRACLRIARREVWRSKARSLVVMAMIGIPVMLVAAALIVTRTGSPSEDETTLRGLGAADAMVVADSRTPVVQGFAGGYEPADGEDTNQGAEGSPWTAREVAAKTGGRVVPMRTGKALLTTDKGAIAAEVRELDIRDPVFDGLATLRSGRAPAKPGEVLVSEPLAERGYEPGTDLRTADRTLRIVGVVRNPFDFSLSEIVGLGGSVLGAGEPGQLRYLVDTVGAPISWNDVQRLNRLGLVVTSRAVLSNPPPESSQAPQFHTEPPADLASDSLFDAIIIGSVVIEVVLLAGPAFAVGARRQRRQLALLLVAGGTPRDVRRVMLAQALLLGFVASVTGIVLATGAVVAARPPIELLAGAELGPYDFPPVELALLAGLGAFAALAAAFVPATQVGRLQPVRALTGRGDVRNRIGWPLAGGLVTAAGTFAVASGAVQPFDGEARVVVGTLAIVGGLIMTLPALLGLLGRVGGRLPLSLRLAARDTARHRSRSAAAIAAVMGTTIGVTALAIGSSSDFAETRRDYMPRDRPGAMQIQVAYARDDGVADKQVEALTTEVGRMLPGRSVLLTYGVDTPSEGSMRFPELLEPDCVSGECTFVPHWSTGGMTGSGSALLAAEPAELERLTGTLTDRQRETLRSGGVLVPDGAALSASGTVRVRTYRVDAEESTSTVTELPGAAAPQLSVRGATGYSFMAEMAVSRQTAERLGLAVQPIRIVSPPGGPEITATQEADLQELVTGLSPGSNVYVERGFQESYTFVFVTLAVLGGLVVLVGTATSTALSLDDARPDAATLAAIGAAPRTRRAQAMAYAVVIGLTGALLGVLAGAAPGIAITWPLTTPSPGGHIIDMPWLLLGLVVLAVPLFTALCAALFTRSSLPMVRRAA